jgi:hypothetical protein
MQDMDNETDATKWPNQSVYGLDDPVKVKVRNY